MDKNLIQLMIDNQSKMSTDMVDMKVLLTKQEENLSYHIKRTNLLEEQVAINKKEYIVLLEKIDKDLKPIKAHVAVINASLKIIGGLSVILSIGASVVKILSYFS